MCSFGCYGWHTLRGVYKGKTDYYKKKRKMEQADESSDSEEEAQSIFKRFVTYGATVSGVLW